MEGPVTGISQVLVSLRGVREGDEIAEQMPDHDPAARQGGERPPTSGEGGRARPKGHIREGTARGSGRKFGPRAPSSLRRTSLRAVCGSKDACRRVEPSKGPVIEMMWDSCGNGWWGYGAGLFTMLFIALIVVGIVLLMRSPRERREERGRGSRALELLDERFARGEIDAQEYEERRRLLSP